METGLQSEKKYTTLIFCHVIDAFVLHFQKLEPKMLFKSDLYFVTSKTSEPMSKWKIELGLKNGFTSSEIVNPFILTMKCYTAWVHMCCIGAKRDEQDEQKADSSWFKNKEALTIAHLNN